MRTLLLSLSFGATSLTDCLDLALTSLGGRTQLKDPWCFDRCGSRHTEIDLDLVREDLFLPEAGTTLCLPSLLDNEFVNVMAPGEGLSCWSGKSDHRSDLEDRVSGMLCLSATLYLAIGIDESPDVSDEILARGEIMEESGDYTVAAAWRTSLNLPFEVKVNEGLLRRYEELRWIEPAFSAKSQ